MHGRREIINLGRGQLCCQLRHPSSYSPYVYKKSWQPRLEVNPCTISSLVTKMTSGSSSSSSSSSSSEESFQHSSRSFSTTAERCEWVLRSPVRLLKDEFRGSLGRYGYVLMTAKFLIGWRGTEAALLISRAVGVEVKILYASDFNRAKRACLFLHSLNSKFRIFSYFEHCTRGSELAIVVYIIGLSLIRLIVLRQSTIKSHAGKSLKQVASRHVT